MHVVQFFQPFLLTPNIHIVKAALPDAPGAVIAHRGGEGRSPQHPSTPWKLAIPLKILEHENRRALLEALHHLRGVGPLRGPDQQVEVLRHQNVAEELEAQAEAQLVEGLHPVTAKALGIEKARATIGAGSEIMEVVEPVIMLLARHGKILHLGAAHMPKNGMYAPPAVGGKIKMEIPVYFTALGCDVYFGWRQRRSSISLPGHGTHITC